MIRTDREAFIMRTEELAARLSRISQPLPPPNTAYNAATGRWDVPQPRAPEPVEAMGWDDDDDEELYAEFYGEDQCTPSRRTRLTAQPQAQPKPITYAQYDPAFDVYLHPELDVPAPPPAKPERAPVPVPKPVPAEPEGIPVEWPRRVVQPVPLSARR